MQAMVLLHEDQVDGRCAPGEALTIDRHRTHPRQIIFYCIAIPIRIGPWLCLVTPRGSRMKDHLTIDDLDLEGKTVIYRVDINCPLQESTLELANDNRIREILPTLKDMLARKAKVVILAHQSRPGEWDYTPLERHAKRTSELLGQEVRYVDDLYGDEAKRAIAAMGPGTAIMLRNVRDEPGELDKSPMDVHAQSKMVKELASVADVYVSDAFGAAHRSQCSLVGFQALLPSAAGRLMQKELEALHAVFDSPSHPCVFVLGGSKFSDAIKVVDRVLTKGIADKVLLVGLAGNAFLKAKGFDLGKRSEEILMKEFTEENLHSAKVLLDMYSERIFLPTDVALDDNGKRKDVRVSELPSVNDWASCPGRTGAGSPAVMGGGGFTSCF